MGNANEHHLYSVCERPQVNCLLSRIRRRTPDRLDRDGAVGPHGAVVFLTAILWRIAWSPLLGASLEVQDLFVQGCGMVTLKSSEHNYEVPD